MRLDRNIEYRRYLSGIDSYNVIDGRPTVLLKKEEFLSTLLSLKNFDADIFASYRNELSEDTKDNNHRFI